MIQGASNSKWGSAQGGPLLGLPVLAFTESGLPNQIPTESR
ncbi:hypothetical protein MGWOODY_Mmi1285 [hydrothermal vent metagenome]|uniref:Uncharacterized protein n=1 Tax=hydrothermal vent metagenome TaxID=652676 RepID=A0A170QBP4_9ZZZZ